MFPLAIPAITSLADTAVNKIWDRVAESHAAGKAQPSVDFTALLETAGAAQRAAGRNIQEQTAGLPEVKSILAATSPGTKVEFVVSADGSLSKVSSAGAKQNIPLSAGSQASLRQWTAANHGAPFAVALRA